MKFRVLRNVFLGRNKKTGQAASITKGEIVEFDLEDIGQIDSFVRDLVITPLDDVLVKDNARYKTLHNYRIEINGEVVSGKVGDEPLLKREVACYLMARGYIRPKDENAWYPGERDPQITQMGEAKKMYDSLDDATQKECGWMLGWKEGKQ